MRTELKTIWLAGCMATLLCARIALAQTTLSVGTALGYPGITVPVPVRVHNVSNVVAAQFDVAFDSSKVSALQSVLGVRLTNHVIRSRQLASGLHRVLIYSLTNAMVGRSNALAATIPFAVSPFERTNSSPIVPGNVVMSRADATAVTQLEADAGEIFIVPVHRNADGSASFFFSSEPGTNYVIQATTNLVDWLNVSTNVALSEWLDLVDLGATNYPMRFYRTVR